MNSDLLKVTCVIPTRNRPEMVSRAVETALAQTYSNIEVIVVVDGPDQDTVRSLESLKEPRLRVVALEENVGGSQARNIGILESTGEWIALLDDDDEWMPNKLELQMFEAARFGLQPVVIASQYIDRTSTGDMVRPKEFQQKGQPISEYLFCTTSIFHPRQGFVQTSTLLAPKSLFLEVPFTRGLKRNQDTDWLLRAVPRTRREVQIVPEILTIFHNEQRQGRIGSTVDWRYSYRWAIDNRQLFTCKALGAFLSTVCLGVVMKQPRAYRNAARLFYACVRHAAVTPVVIWLFLRNGILAPTFRSIFPMRLRRRIEVFIYQ